MSAAPQNPNQAIDAMSPITATHVVLMIALAAAAVLVIWWGAVLRHRRKAAERQVAENFEVAEEHGATSEPGESVRENETATVSADVPEPAGDSPAGDTSAGETPVGETSAGKTSAGETSASETPVGETPADETSIGDNPAGGTPIAADLTQIKGLGPKAAALLAGRGITRVAQLAALTPQAAEALDADLGTFRGRMTRDRWIEQAQLLSAGDHAGYEAAFGKLGA